MGITQISERQQNANTNDHAPLFLQMLHEMRTDIALLKRGDGGGARNVSVETWLRNVGLETFCDMFREHGLETVSDVQRMSKEQFEAMSFDVEQQQNKQQL